MNVNEQIDAVLPLVTDLRHDLHRHPELSGDEERTARVVSEILTRHGIVHETGVGGTHGIVATIGKSGGKTLALRGDMDALPIEEQADPPYKSTVPGRMHACGHDGHTANLVGTALVLKSIEDSLPGRVKLLFQPAEEVVGGAKELVAAGAVDDVDAIIMLHGWPDLAPGQIGVRTGPAMASSDTFTIQITGRGGHAAYPHKTIDPILVGAHVVTALQSVVSREISPVAPAVVGVTMFHAGTAKNIIAPEAKIGGTVRSLDKAIRDEMPSILERIVGGVCGALRAEYAFDYHFGTPVTVNDAAISDVIRAAGTAVLGAENVVELAEPTMGAEDFAYYLERVPGAMFRLGVGCPYALHHPKYDFGDEPLRHGIAVMVEAARRFLAD